MLKQRFAIEAVKLDGFQTADKLSVEPLGYAWGDMQKNIFLRAKSNTLPDIAQLSERWLPTFASLDTLAQWQAAGQFRTVVPSHGPVHEGAAGIAQTRDWLQWLSARMQDSAERGLDLGEVLRVPVPERFARWAAQPAELHRTLAQWYPRYEQRALGASATRP